MPLFKLRSVSLPVPLATASNLHGLSGLHPLRYVLSRFDLRQPQLERLLEVQPQLRCRAEVAWQAQSRVGGHPLLALQDRGGAERIIRCDAKGLLTIRAVCASFVSDRFVTFVEPVVEDNPRALATMNLRLQG